MASQHELAMHEDLLNDRQDQAPSAEFEQKHDVGTAEQSAPTKSLPSPVHPSEPKALDSRDVESLEEITDCMVQFQTSEPVGFLNPAQDKYSIGLSLQGGKSGPVSVGLSFRQPGQIDGIFARKTWHLVDKLPGQWIVQDFRYVFAHTVPLNKAANHPKVISQLQADDEAAGRLVCITLRVMPLPKESYRASIVYQSSRDFISCLRGIFESDQAHNVRIWFLVSKSNLDLGVRLLAAMKHRYNHREHPLSHVQDDSGVRFSDHLAQQTNFASLPRELRDRIYELTLLTIYAGTPCLGLNWILEIENGCKNRDKEKAYALFSTRASTVHIAAEAREFFYQRCHFGIDLCSSDIEKFVEDQCWSAARSNLTTFEVVPQDIRVPHPDILAQQLDLLLSYRNLRAVEIRVIQARSPHPNANFDRYELQETLTNYAEACSHLYERLGDSLRFELHLGCTEYDEPEDGELRGGSFRVMMNCGMIRLKELCAALDGPSSELAPSNGWSAEETVAWERKLWAEHEESCRRMSESFRLQWGG